MFEARLGEVGVFLEDLAVPIAAIVLPQQELRGEAVVHPIAAPARAELGRFGRLALFVREPGSLRELPELARKAFEQRRAATTTWVLTRVAVVLG